MIDSEYSVIGYYDGLDMKTFQDDESEYLNVLSDPGITMLQEIDAEHVYECYNIVGIRNKCDLINEEAFWKNESLPFVFISSVRLKDMPSDLDELIDRIESEMNSLCYVSLDSSDLIICSRTNCYSEGYLSIEQHWKLIEQTGNQVQKCFTNLVIKQDTLETIHMDNLAIKEENVCCILSGVIRSWNNIDSFLDELKRQSNGAAWKQFGTLGSDDIVIKTESISISKLLAMYKKSGLLVHDNPIYRAAFVNIRTEILVERNKGADDSAK